MDKKELAEFSVQKLKMRFSVKINPEEYYLSYSGGKDSHLLYWFIKEILHDDKIRIVGVNTRMEHHEILYRIKNNSDVVLVPRMKPFEIKEKYGIPCFTKWQDEVIRRYQGGSRAKSTLEGVTGENRIKFKLNNRAKTLLFSGKLHKISPYCCKKTKKEPLKRYEKDTGLKPITGVRGSESAQRKSGYATCLKDNGMFTPLYDFTDDMVDAIYDIYDIEEPEIYKQLDRTGCFGCPYGNHGGNTEKELDLLTVQQKNFTVELFKESYDVLGIRY